jgi:hypothetical protein
MCLAGTSDVPADAVATLHGLALNSHRALRAYEACGRTISHLERTPTLLWPGICKCLTSRQTMLRPQNGWFPLSCRTLLCRIIHAISKRLPRSSRDADIPSNGHGLFAQASWSDAMGVCRYALHVRQVSCARADALRFLSSQCENLKNQPILRERDALKCLFRIDSL